MLLKAAAEHFLFTPVTGIRRVNSFAASPSSGGTRVPANLMKGCQPLQRLTPTRALEGFVSAECLLCSSEKQGPEKIEKRLSLKKK